MTRARVLLSTLCVVALAGFAFSRLSFNVNPLDLLPSDLREVEGLRVFTERFAGEGELLITLETTEGDREAMAKAAEDLATQLATPKGLARAVQWRPVWEAEPHGAAELPAYLWLNGEPGRLQQLAARLEEGASRETIAEAIDELSFGIDGESLAMAAYDPFGLLRPGVGAGGLGADGGDGKFASPDGLFRVVYLSSQEAEMGYREAAEWLERVRTVVDGALAEIGAPDDLVVGYTGEPAFAAEIGGGMQRDMTGSISAAVALIHLLFWVMHRRLVPLAAIFLSLLATLSATVVLGSFVFGKLSVMSVGFAAILVGLAVDYGVVLYQQARAEPGDFGSLRRAVGPGILWAALTTAAVFASLGLSSLPGIRELGLLVALGILIGASVMLWSFGPLASALGRANPASGGGGGGGRGRRGRWALPLSLLAVAGAGAVLGAAGLPELRTDFEILRPRQSAADEAFVRTVERLAPDGRLAQPLVVRAEGYPELVERSEQVSRAISGLEDSGAVASSTFVPELVPSAVRQGRNRDIVAGLLRSEERLRGELDEVFDPEVIGVFDAVFSAWRGMLGGAELPATPRGKVAADLLAQVVAGGVGDVAALAMLRVSPGRTGEVDAALAGLEGVYLTGWPALGPAVRPLVLHDLRAVFLPMACVLLAMLVAMFRDPREVLLAVGVLSVSGVLLLAAMRVAGWGWDFLNICAFPLLLGTGIDYTVHMMAALRRHGGARLLVWRSIGRALLFCGVSTAIGFGSLAFASNAGLASLGRVCAAGILITMLVAVTMLPAWWRALGRRDR